jgi:two-component system NtrC family sensor kinase
MMTDKELMLLASIFDAMVDSIYIIKDDYTIEFMNKAMIKEFEDGKGKKCYQWINHLDEVCPCCRAKEVFAGKTVYWEKYVPKTDKTYELVELPLRNSDGTVSKVSIFRDITQRKKGEEKLKATEEDYKRLFEHAGCGVFIGSKEGKFLDANQALLNMLGYKSKEELLKIDMTKDLYLRPEDRKKFQERVEREGRVIDYELDFKRKDGMVIPVLVTVHARHDQQGNVVGYEGINVDQSQRKQMEKDLKERLEMERKLRDIQEQLLQSEKLAAMGKLTSQIAHELNNPLYGIMNTLELLKTEIPPQNKRRKILEMSLSETVRLTELLRKMLSFSRPDEEEKQLVDINTILDEILLLVRKQLQENSIRISSSFADDLQKIYASKNQLRQVFLNMISNARDAMPDGGTLTIKTMAKGDQIRIEISDTGIGIGEENIDKIFDAFFTTKDSIKYVGLGLSVCYGFIKDHEGDIKVISKVGSGTTFTIILPTYRSNEKKKVAS